MNSSASRFLRRSALALGLALALVLVRPTTSAEPQKKPAEPKFTPEQVAFFEKEVLPVLQEHCLRCHGEEKDKGGLRLNSRAAILRGGDTGPAVSLDKPEASLLLRAIRFDTELQMPPKGKLPEKHLATLAKWVKEGLPFTPGGSDTPHTPKTLQVTEKDREYWAYRPVQAPAVPKVRNNAWVSNPVDAFLLARMEEKGLTPVKPADRVALIRRASYDLTGLPPTPEEVDAFVKDAAPDAYEKLLDRLLASPQYGEKWGRHWLDLVRFAETHGYERDSPKPFAWRYRDYVIRSFNDDKPYDQFLREQLAGDELDQVTAETLTATGYYRLGIWDDEPADRLQARYDVLDDIVSTTSQVMLGMTVGCARCHDHKKDPVPQRDYYRLLACFHDISDMNQRNLRKVANDADRKVQDEERKRRQEQEGKLYQQVYQIEQKFALALAKEKGVKVEAGADLEGLTYRFYRDTWDRLPNFNSLKHETEGPVASNRVSLAPASRQEAIGLVFEGRLKVPQDGEYTFAVESSEGVRLLLDGQRVINRPTTGSQSADGKATLKAGLVPFRLEYFNSYTKPRLALSWSGPGVEKRWLTATAGEGGVVAADSRGAGQEWRYTTEKPGDGWARPDYKDQAWKKGPGGFGRAGTPGAVVRTEWTTGDIWLRRTFELKEKPTALTLDLHHDEDVEVYLNGTLVHQAKRFLTAYTQVPLGPDALQALAVGVNTLAVHCKQSGGGQYIDVGLRSGGQVDLAAMFRRHGRDLLGDETADRYLALTAELEKLRAVKPPEAGLDVMCVAEAGRKPTHVLVRGSAHVKGDEVTAGAPEVLARQAVEFKARADGPASGKRRALAEWIASPANPLTARVMVNRLWHYHFGKGIVASTNDFGKLGDAPTHPELLDWLADDLVKGGWKLKRLHKLLMLSSAYRLSSAASPEGLKVDPGNSLLWRFNSRRLTAEEVRDSMLAVGGTLNKKQFGPSIYVDIPREVLAGQSRPGEGWGKSPPDEQARRSIYIHVKRSLLVPVLAQHDAADTDSSCAVRYTTTVPTQALGMLNGAFTNEQARSLAARLEKESPGDVAAQVKRALRLSSGRTPADDEVRKDVAFVKEMIDRDGLKPGQALRMYCLMVLNTNEFVYLD